MQPEFAEDEGYSGEEDDGLGEELSEKVEQTLSYVDGLHSTIVALLKENQALKAERKAKGVTRIRSKLSMKYRK